MTTPDQDPPPGLTDNDLPPFESLPPATATAPNLRKSKSNPRSPIPVDRLPPHSEEAERGVLGCVLESPECLSEAKARLPDDRSFYDLRNRSVWRAMCEMENNGGIDLITLHQHLKDGHQLDSVGGLSYLQAIQESTVSSANLTYYTDIVAEKYALRRLIQFCTDTVGRAFEGDQTGELIESVQRGVSELSLPSTAGMDEAWTIKDLMAYDIDHDPNAVIGLSRDGRTTRYLCRGYGAWLIGQSGIGKSSLVLQQSFCFCLGRPFCGITPVRPLRVLIVQSENDIGDNAETVQGVCNSMPEMTPQLMDQVRARLKIIRCRGRTGAKFCQWLEHEVKLHKADLVYVDPLLRFAGIEVSRQDQVTQFLNNCLDPVLARTGVVMLGAHHTGKPKNRQELKGQTIYDMAYSGIGSSELVNWARAITIIEAVDEGVFRMILSKRGNRAFACHPDGTNSTILYLKHAFDRIYWEQTEPPETSPPTTQGRPSGRKSKVMEIATSNLFEFCSACIRCGHTPCWAEVWLCVRCKGHWPA